jgi:hypothetical protein
MDPAAYGVIGACVGAAVTGVVTILNARAQARLRSVELAQQELGARRTLVTELRREKAQRYATFLSAFWQEERYVSEMLEHLTARRSGWSDAIRRINTSAEHYKVVDTLNESMGWISILCQAAEVEEAAAALNTDFDRMMELFSLHLDRARREGDCDPNCVQVQLEQLRAKARALSALLRKDLGVVSLPELQSNMAP